MQDKTNLPAPTKATVLQSKSLLKQGESWTPENQANLAIAVGQAFDAQKQFGKTPGQIKNIVAVFAWVLKDYDFNSVMAAFATYIKRHSDIPTPSDIVKIIDPEPPKFVPDKSMYYKLCKMKEEGGPYALQAEEEAYCKTYEAFMLKNMRDSA